MTTRTGRRAPRLAVGIACGAALIATSFPTAGRAEEAAPVGPRKISFPSGDGLEITADFWSAPGDAKAPLVVLFHQAGWSRGEYLEIAPRLNALGFDCLAIDQRSGGEVNDVVNETHARAVEAGLPTEYVDARGDLVAALEYAREHFAPEELIAWGSSYSAALVLKLAGDRPELADAVLSFSPGEYFERSGKPATWIRDSASKIECPVFVTSARGEYSHWEAIYAAIPSAEKAFFLPETKGNHGSRALWARFDDSPAYWKAVETFLDRLGS